MIVSVTGSNALVWSLTSNTPSPPPSGGPVNLSPLTDHDRGSQPPRFPLTDQGLQPSRIECLRLRRWCVAVGGAQGDALRLWSTEDGALLFRALHLAPHNGGRRARAVTS